MLRHDLRPSLVPSIPTYSMSVAVAVIASPSDTIFNRLVFLASDGL